MEGGLKAVCSKEERDKADFFVKVTDVSTYLYANGVGRNHLCCPAPVGSWVSPLNPILGEEKSQSFPKGLLEVPWERTGVGPWEASQGGRDQNVEKGKGVSGTYLLYRAGGGSGIKKKKKSVQAAVRAGEKEGEHGLSEGHDCGPIESLLSLLLQTG